MSDVDRIIALIRDWHRELATDETGVEEHVEALVEHALRDLVGQRDAARQNAVRLAITLVQVEDEINAWDGAPMMAADRIRAALAGPASPGQVDVSGALITAAQTGQVIVGAYATGPQVDAMVACGLGEYITDDDTGVIGFSINDAGRREALRLTAAGGAR